MHPLPNTNVHLFNNTAAFQQLLMSLSNCSQTRSKTTHCSASALHQKVLVLFCSFVLSLLLKITLAGWKNGLCNQKIHTWHLKFEPKCLTPKTELTCKHLTLISGGDSPPIPHPRSRPQISPLPWKMVKSLKLANTRGPEVEDAGEPSKEN
jgi:hypothetical protein